MPQVPCQLYIAKEFAPHSKAPTMPAHGLVVEEPPVGEAAGGPEFGTVLML